MYLSFLASVLFRLISYSYLAWIPGRQATYAVPICFLISSYPLLISLFESTPTITESNAVVIKKENGIEELNKQIINIDSDNESPSRRSAIRRKKGSSGTSTPTKLVETEISPSIEKKEVNKPSGTTAFSVLKSLVFGTKSPSKFINFSILIFHTLTLAAVMDSIFSPIFSMEEKSLAFSRATPTQNGVKIFARIPPSALSVSTSNTEALIELEKEEFSGAKVEYRPTLSKKWIKAGNLIVEENKDWTGVLNIQDLYSSTEYEYRLLLPSTISHTYHPSFNLQKFTTFPDLSLSTPGLGGGTHYTFASSSCIKPGFPYVGPKSKRDLPGVRYLSAEIEKSSGISGSAIKFLLFLGDFIYNDTPFQPLQDQYNKRYRQVFASEDMRRVTDKIPMFNIYDDHEWYNDFSSNETSPEFKKGNDAYSNYMAQANPTSKYSTNYYDFRYGDSAFFVLDTRRYRSENSVADAAEKTMLGAQQKLDFFNWVSASNETVTWKFVVSSVPFSSLWSSPAGASDTWSGFLTEREEILDVLESVPNVIILSGDRHEFAATSFREGKVTEFSTSPLSQFYLPIRTLSQSHGKGATGEDILLKYLPDGQSKFSTFEVDTRVANKPLVNVKVIIDGVEAWNVTILGSPLKVPAINTGLGGLGLSLLELLGFKKRSWF